MISTAPKLTNAGKSLLVRGIGGEQIIFTRFKIGNGDLGNADPETLDDILNAVIEFPINKADASNDGYVELSGSFDSSNITSDFRWSELGIYAKGTDDVEYLYAYAYDDENAGVLKADVEDVVVEQSVSIIVAVGTAKNVTAIIAPSVLYAQKADFDNHTKAKNPHGITAEMVGLGNVPNVSTNDQTPTFPVLKGDNPVVILSGECLSNTMSKIGLAIMCLIKHLLNKKNPHGVTAEQANAAEKKHQHGAADISTGVLSVARGGTGVGTVEDLRAFLGNSGVVTGVYHGNGAAKRHISLGFTPVAVLVTNANGMTGDDTDGICGGMCVGNYGLVSRNCPIQSPETTWDNAYTAMMIDGTGFYVAYNSNGVATNKNGKSYRYIAWR